MTWHLWRNEWQFYRRQPLCGLSLLLAIAFTALLALTEPALSPQPQKELLLLHSKLLMLVHPLLLGVLAPLAFYRDSQYQMEPLIAATPLTRGQWGLSRAGALLLLVLVLQLGLTLFVTLVATINAATVEAASVSLSASSLLTALSTTSFSITSLWTLACQLLLLQQLPALLLLVALQLWCSQQSQHLGWSYLLTLSCWLGYLLLAAGTGSPVMAQGQHWSPWLSQLMYWLDPYALTPWLVQLQQTDVSLPLSAGFSRDVLINRLLILGLAACLCWRALAAPRKGRHQPSQSATHQSAPSTLFANSKTATSTLIPPMAIRVWPALLSLVKLQSQQLLFQLSSGLALLLLVGLIFSEALTSTGFAEPMSRLIPTSRDALNQVNWDILPRFGLLLVCFWASQLSWLNRQHRCDSLIASTPQPSWLLLTSQWLVLWCLTLLLVLLSLGAVALAQWLSGTPLQGMEYLQQGLLQLLPLWLSGLLALSCHALCRSAFIANLWVCVFLLLSLSPLPPLLGLEHPLWRLGQTALQQPDALWGYQGSTIGPAADWGGDWRYGGHWPYLCFSGGLIMALWLWALPRYHRGSGQSADVDRTDVGRADVDSTDVDSIELGLDRQRAQRLGATGFVVPIGMATAVITGLLLILAASQGGFIHQQLQQAGALQTKQERQHWRAAYEQRYQHWQQQAQPVLSQVALDVRLTPAAQQATIQAELTLTNPHPQAITQLLLGWPDPAFRPADLQQMTLQQGRLQQQDPQLNQWIYQFEQPLAPGASTRVSLRLQIQQTGLAPLQFQQIIRPEFSYLRLWQLLPQPGFQRELRLTGAHIRAQHGLAPLPDSELKPSVQSALTTPKSARYDWVQLDTHLHVPAGYQGIAAGKLRRQWRSGAEQQSFHYSTSAPIRNVPAVVAVPWQGQQSKVGGVDLALYSPYYNAATDLSWQAMRHTLAWFEQQIGPYPGDSLKLVMAPDLGPTGYALPQLVLINHRVGLRADAAPDAGFSQIYRRTVHEMAHQWFGHGIGNGVPGDGTFLVEALAKYAELVLLQQHFGQAAMQALVDFERQRFVRAHANSTGQLENLLDAAEGHDQYSRATLVFARLRTELGDAVITAALKQLWQQHRYPARPASAMDFVRALRAHSPATQHDLIQQLLLSTDSRWIWQHAASREH